jgi:Zn-dependent M28 family amino/carboxypeptidase
VAVVLELARIAAGTDLPYSVEFVFFGAEEEDWPYGCFFGSQWFVSQMDPGAIAAMICVDMVGRGDRLYAWYTGQRPAKLTASLARDAEQLQLPLAIRQGLPHSDHVPFEWAQVPAIWLQRLPDPDNHTARDLPENVSVAALAQVGELVERQVRGE